MQLILALCVSWLTTVALTLSWVVYEDIRDGISAPHVQFLIGGLTVFAWVPTFLLLWVSFNV